MSKRSSTLQNYFIGEYVTLILTQETSITSESEEGIIEQSIPLTGEGYLIDMDDMFYYLGVEPEVVSCAVKRKHVLQIVLTDPANPYDQILDAMPEAEEKDIN
jgi:hypothetical protein